MQAGFVHVIGPIRRRPRLLRLFEFDYRFEIFRPDHKRRWGVYVVPFELGDHLVARVGLKAERESGQLLVRSSKEELETLARWLGLSEVAIMP